MAMHRLARLVRTTDESKALLVMGAVSRSQLSRPVIGSTAEAAIDPVECDLFVVKPARFKSPVRHAKLKDERVHFAA